MPSHLLNQLWIKISYNSNNSTENADVSLLISASQRLRVDLPLFETISIEYIAINELHRIQIYNLYPNRRICNGSGFFILRCSNRYQLAQPHKKESYRIHSPPTCTKQSPICSRQVNPTFGSPHDKKKKKKMFKLLAIDAEEISSICNGSNGSSYPFYSLCFLSLFGTIPPKL
jgi:hypothetical protein